jgi:uncharacterized protein involved in exopolysaccharide biosynthesis
MGMMSTSNALIGPLRNYLQALRNQLWLWVTPTVVFTVLGLAYALIRADQWGASQALVVRDEAIGSYHIPGRFDSTESLRASQEMILEVARSRVAVLGALRVLGPPKNRPSAASWPSEDEIAVLQDNISVSAPKGSEFGTTEVIYLTVNGPSRERAIQQTAAVCDQLEKRLSDLRNAKAASVIAEFENTLAIALEDQEQATARLERMEVEVGSDLGELRILNDYGSGDSNLRAALNQIKAELRQAASAHEAMRQMHELLLAARDDPDQLLTTPARLLQSQPTLGRLREGLVDSQLRTATLRGRMRDDHPSVVAAIRAEQKVRQSIDAELAVSLRGVTADLQVSEQQLESLNQQQHELQSRLSRLAGLRARYSNLVDDLAQSTEIVNEAKQSLVEARASQIAAQSTSLLTRFQSPVAGEHPNGPGKSQIVAAGFVGGLLIGIGLVVLGVPTRPSSGRRWTDFLPFGRRAADRLSTATPANRPNPNIGRRSADHALVAKTNSPSAIPVVEQRQNHGRRASDPTS